MAVSPAKLEANVEQLVNDGMTPANVMLLPYTQATFVSVMARVVRGLDKATRSTPPLPRDRRRLICIDTRQVGAARGTPATEYFEMRNGQNFCSQHPDDPTLWCLDQLQLHCYSPGIFLAAHRDRPTIGPGVHTAL